MRFPFLSFLTKKPAHRPPFGEVHFYFDSATTSFRFIDNDGNDVAIGSSVTTSTGGDQNGDQGKVPVYDLGGVLRATQFRAYNDPDPDVLDYGATLSCGASGSTSGALILCRGPGQRITVTVPSVTGGRSLFLPDMSGTVAVASNATYADDAAAALGGIAVGQIYSTGTIFRTRMS